MEYAMMAVMDAVVASVPIVALVHDCQIIDLPASLFSSHDVPVDYIVTPTRILRCDDVSRRRPDGIIWSLLTADRVSRVPVLGLLRRREHAAGSDVRLAGEAESPNAVETIGNCVVDGDEQTMTSRQTTEQPLQPTAEQTGTSVASKNLCSVGGDDVRPCRRGRRVQHLN
jgi:hypothetical protein